jgi:hypothetical protein
MMVFGLLRQLRSRTVAGRLAAIRAAPGFPPDWRVTRRLIQLAQRDPHAEVRAAAILALKLIYRQLSRQDHRRQYAAVRQLLESEAALDDMSAGADPDEAYDPDISPEPVERGESGADNNKKKPALRPQRQGESSQPPPMPAPARPPQPTSKPAPHPWPSPPQIHVPKMEESVEERAKEAALPDAQSAPVDVAEGGEAVQFSCFYPREVEPQVWQPLAAYIYRGHAAQATVADAIEVFGTQLETMRRTTSDAAVTIPEGTLITATPQLEGFQFNPPSVTIGFFEAWHRLDFKLRAASAALNLSANGHLSFTVEGVIIAQVPLSVFVGKAAAQPTTLTGGTSRLYTSIFCSYSRDDAEIVNRVERAYRILGFDFLRDVHTLKSGQDWNDALYDLIRRADIFQLFWSQTAADSKFVEQEWRYALDLDRDERNFIRPVYWQEPMPSVPQELGHIHFAFDPQLDDDV